MSEKQWVCHISGQGEKLEIQAIQDPEWPSWVAPHTVAGGGLLYLPKSEYRLCDPPEVWRDVNKEILCNARQAFSDLKNTVSTLEIALSGLDQ